MTNKTEGSYAINILAIVAAPVTVNEVKETVVGVIVPFKTQLELERTLFWSPKIHFFIAYYLSIVH